MLIIERAPAKINLSQDLNYEIDKDQLTFDMVMTSLTLTDEVIIEEIPTPQLIVETTRSFLPEDWRNYAYQAAYQMMKKAEYKKGLRVTIQKNIPVSAGLGGGSSDAAAVLRGLNRLWQLNLSQEDLIALALSIDEDAPYCLLGGTCHIWGRGDQIKRLGNIPSYWVVLIKPPISVSTTKMLKVWKKMCPLSSFRTPEVVKAIQSENEEALFNQIGNDLEAVTFNQYPQLKILKQKMIKFGALGVTMTGSGATIIGFAKTQRKAQNLYNALKGFCREVYISQLSQEDRVLL